MPIFESALDIIHINMHNKRVVDAYFFVLSFRVKKLTYTHSSVLQTNLFPYNNTSNSLKHHETLTETNDAICLHFLSWNLCSVLHWGHISLSLICVTIMIEKQITCFVRTLEKYRLHATVKNQCIMQFNMVSYSLFYLLVHLE